MPEGNYNLRFIRQAGVIVGSGGLIFGYDIGIIAGTLHQLKDQFNLNDAEEGLVVSILYAGSLLGCGVGFILCDRIGRLKTIHIQNIIFVLGAVITAAANDLGTLCFGRFIVGIAAALSGICDVPYLLEVSPAEHRGELSSMYEILVSVGVVLAFMMGLLLVVMPDDTGWRVAFAIPCFFAILQSIGMHLFMPESPKWLMEKGRVQEATMIFTLIYGSMDAFPADIVIELDQARRAYSGTVCDSPGSTAPTHSDLDSNTTISPLQIVQSEESEKYTSIHDIRKADSSADSAQDSQIVIQSQVSVDHVALLQQYMYPMYLISALQFLSQITGGVVVRNYSPTIFENNGISRSRALLFNVILGAIKVLFTVFSVSIIEDMGRLRLLEYGAILVGIGMLFLMLASAASAGGNLNSPIVFLFGASLCLGGYGIGYGPIVFVLSAEMFPTAVRGSAMAISLLVSNLSQLFTNFLFLPATDLFTAGGVFAFFVVMNVLSVVFIRAMLVETKQQEPLEILHAVLEKRKGLRNAWEGSTVGKACCACFQRASFTTCSTSDEGDS
jgi:SP family galactose:H+ symporter-like MFS transporter